MLGSEGEHPEVVEDDDDILTISDISDWITK